MTFGELSKIPATLIAGPVIGIFMIIIKCVAYYKKMYRVKITDGI